MVPSLVDGSLSPAAAWTWMRRAAPLSREPGQLGPQDTPLVAPQSPTGPWVVTAEGEWGRLLFLPTLPLRILLPISFSQWMEDLLRMLVA